MTRDKRPLAIGLTLLGVIAGALLVQQLPSEHAEVYAVDSKSAKSPPDKKPPHEGRSAPGVAMESSANGELTIKTGIDPTEEPDAHARQMRLHEIQVQFDYGVETFGAGDLQEAAKAFHRVIELAPELPDAHVNLGYTFLAQEEYAMARDFFDGAIGLAPTQANAYFGLAEAYEGLNELELAMSAMRSYLHLVPMENPEARIEDGGQEALFAARARSALWEWEAKLERGPWGENRGIPWGLTEKEVRRDGTGVGMVALRPDGTAIAMESPNKPFDKEKP